MKRKLMLLAAVALPLLHARADDPARAVIRLSWESALPFLTFDLTSGTGYWIEERTSLTAGAWEPAQNTGRAVQILLRGAQPLRQRHLPQCPERLLCAE